jgi:hypothetical protein
LRKVSEAIKDQFSFFFVGDFVDLGAQMGTPVTLRSLSLEEVSHMNQESNKRSQFGKTGTLFIRKNLEHPIAEAYEKLKMAHKKEGGEVVRATKENIKTLALAICQAKQLRVKGNLIAMNTIAKEVLDECNLLVVRSTLVRAVESIERGIPVLEPGRPTILSSEMEEVLKERLELRHLKIGSIRTQDIKYETLALCREKGTPFQASNTWPKSYLKKRNPKHYSCKAMEVVRSLKTQPEHGLYISGGS